MAVVDEGNSNRRVSSHLLNKDSSRSHSLLTVYLQSEWTDAEDGHLIKKFGKARIAVLSCSVANIGLRFPKISIVKQTVQQLCSWFPPSFHGDAATPPELLKSLGNALKNTDIITK